LIRPCVVQPSVVATLAEMPGTNARDDARATVIVRNPVVHDARILRAANTLLGLGYQVEILGIQSRFDADPPAAHGPVPIRRLGSSRSLAPALQRAVERLRKPAESAVTSESARRRFRGPGLVVKRLYLGLKTLAYYCRAIRALRERPPALLHCNDYSTMWPGVFARLALGSRVIYDTHELWADRNGRYESRAWLSAAESLFVRVAHQSVATSPGHAHAIARRYRVEPPTVVRNIPDVVPHAGPVDPPPGPPTAVYVGSVIPQRGLEQAIEALAMVPELRLRVVGAARPTYRAILAASARAHGVQARVDFCEPVAPQEVVGVARGAMFGLALFQPNCRSYVLGLPNKLSEYALAGVPALVSDLPVHRLFVEELGAGELVDAASPAAIAAGFRMLLDPDRQRAIRARLADAPNRLSWSHERRVLENVYRAAVAMPGE
jgi:glycosyltransferase involved in cell wall biosynthesis